MTTNKSKGDLAATRWLSQAEAADYLGVTDRTVRNYIRRGAITGHKLPGSRLIRLDRSEIDAAMKPLSATEAGETS